MRVELGEQAQKAFRKLESRDRDRVAVAFDALARDPRPPGKHVKAITSARGLLRYRVGDLRIIYEVDDARNVVLVVAIVRRRDLERSLRRTR